MKKVFLVILDVFAIFMIFERTGAEKFILFDVSEESGIYSDTVDAVIVEIKEMIRETDCGNYDKGKVYIAVSKEKPMQVAVYFIDKRLGQIEEVSSSPLRRLALCRERKDFAVKTARCLYLFYEAAGN